MESSFHLPNRGFPEDLRKKIVEIEKQLSEYTHVVAGMLINRYYRLNTDLEVFARPDYARIDGAGRGT
jgi:hypothetical protein